MRIAALCLLVALCSASVAQRRHLDVEATLRYTWAINAVQDIAQTTDFSAHGFHELNPAVKKWVDNKRLFPFVVATAGTCYLLDRGIQSIRDEKTRIGAYAVLALVEGYAVAHNRKLFHNGFPLFYLKFKV